MVKNAIKKPIIGIISKNITIEEFFGWSWQRVSNDVRYAINKCGALAMGIMPQTTRKVFNQQDEHEDVLMTEEEKNDLVTFVKMCDGIVLQGGISSHNYEEFVALYCYENDIPLLGICAGYNNIIRGLGGKAEKIENIDVHDRPDLTYAHGCKVVDESSLFAKIVKEKEFQVNSVHTYVGTVIPKTLSVVVFSDDGQVEVVEAKNKRFFIGVKYHPELLVDIDEKQNNIFCEFIKACKKK